HRLQAVAHVRQRAADDHAHRVIEVRSLHLLDDGDGRDVAVAASWRNVVAVVDRRFGSQEKSCRLRVHARAARETPPPLSYLMHLARIATPRTRAREGKSAGTHGRINFRLKINRFNAGSVRARHVTWPSTIQGLRRRRRSVAARMAA